MPKKVKVTWEIGNRGKMISQKMDRKTAKAFATMKQLQFKKVKVDW